VAVDHQGLSAEGLDSAGVAVEIPFQLGRAALAEPVHVDNGSEIAEVVVAGLVQRLPDRALGGLAVPAQHPGVIVEAVQAAASQTHPDRVRQPLAERPGGYVHPGQDRGGVALQAGTEASVGLDQLRLIDHPDRPEHRIEQRGGMPL